jgi:TonB-dependent starch-binding outer membrane protein SusC
MKDLKRLLFKPVIIIKCSVLLILISVANAQARGNQSSITLSMEHAEISKVLNKIEKTTAGEFRFLYNYDLPSLKKKVDVNFQQTTIADALSKLFANTDLTYKILENNLIVVMTAGTEKQQIRITGKVTGASGEPLPGVSVRVKNSNIGTATDNIGDYTLTVNENAILVFSYVGYADKEVAVNGQNIVNVQLSISDRSLNQVVVIGYGSQRKKDLTGSVSVVTAADIANRPIVNSAEALQGKAAGVEVTSNSGKPGAGLTIRIRGSSSISAGNDPLYIVDGIPVTDISAFNPGDIESISVLKDAGSASIYGTRAANGVVVITTKKGTAGKSKINASVYFGVSKATKIPSVLNGKQYQDYANELDSPAIAVTDAQVAAVNINWPKEVFQTGNQQNYQVSIAGGNEKTQHYISLDYLNQTGIVKPATFDRLTARVNLTTKATDWLTVITSTVVSRSHNQDVKDNFSVARGGVVLSALETPSTVPKYDSDGRIGFNPLKGWANPYGAILGGYTKFLSDRLLSNVGVDIKLYKGLVFQSRFGIDYENDEATSFEDPFLTSNISNGNPSSHNRTKSNVFTWLSEQTLNYTMSQGKNHFSALAGWTAQSSHTDGASISGSHMATQYRFESWDAGYLRDSIHSAGTTFIDDWALVSYLGRITYDYDGKYLFQANVRSDISSRFAKGNRTAVFPSFSAGWRISQEAFMQSQTLFNDLKLRVGWGQNGNQQGLGSFEYLPLSNVTVSTDTTTNGSVTPSTTAPASLTWETSTQTNIGVDAELLDHRISFSGDFYIKKTKNVLYDVPIPSQSGYPNAPVNGASMQNIGEEFMISSKNIIKNDLKWSTDFTISFNKNKVTSLYHGISSSPLYGDVTIGGSGTPLHSISLAQGYGLGEFYGFVAKGVDKNTGHELYQSGDSVTDAPILSDRRFLGSAQPKFVYGLSNNITYKSFDLTVFIQGSFGNKIYNAAEMELESMQDAANQSSAILRRWRKPGDITDIPGVRNTSRVDPNTGLSLPPTYSLISSQFVESGSYLRFKTVTLSYNINPKLIDKLGLAAASIYVSGNNLITITKYKGFDPEVNSNGNPIRVNPDGSNSNSNDNRNLSIGLDNGAYPQSRTFLVGINLSLK